MKTIFFVAVLAVLFSTTFGATFNSAMIKGQLSEDKSNVFRCVFDCLYDKIDLSEALRIIGKCLNVEEQLPCFAQEVGEHLYQCVSKCYQNKSPSVCAEKVTKAREHFKGLDKDAKKQFVKKLYESLLKTYPDVCERKVGYFIYALLVKNDDAEKVCELYKKIFGGDKTDEKVATVKNVSECEEKVKQVREHFAKLALKEKAEFAKKVFDKLSEKYKDVPKEKVAFFVAALLYQNLDASKVCSLYKSIFQGLSMSEDLEKFDIFRCTYNCLYGKLPLKEIFRILGKCLNVEDQLPCFAQELGQHLYECVSQCYGVNNGPKKEKSESKCEEKVTESREFFKGLDRDGKKEFIKKLYVKLTTKYSTVDRSLVGAFIKKLLFSADEVSSVCALYKETFLKQNVAPVVIDSEKSEPSKCEDKVTKAREFFKGLDRDGKKDFIKKLYVKLTTKFPSVDKSAVGSFIRKLLFTNDEASSVYALYKETFLGSENVAPVPVESKSSEPSKCEKKVTESREYFKGLDKDGKKEFIKKLYVALTTKYSSVDRSLVGAFIRKLLFSADEASSVCALYKETFSGSQNVTPVAVEEQTPNRKDFRCVFDCLYDKLPLNEILRILGKCLNVEDQLPCFAQELGEHLYQCVSRCYSKTESKTEASCPEKVLKVREHFKSLDSQGKKEFYNKVVLKLKENYPQTEEKKTEFFAASLLFEFVPSDVPCSMYEKIFK